MLRDHTLFIGRKAGWNIKDFKKPHCDKKNQSFRLYVDGVEDTGSPVAYSGSIDTNVWEVMIGTNSEYRAWAWNGLIDDVRIYSYALSEAEVKELYAGRGPGPNEKPQWLIDRLNSDSKVSAGPGEAAKSSVQNRWPDEKVRPKGCEQTLAALFFLNF